jgi:hypothetical protein
VQGFTYLHILQSALGRVLISWKETWLVIPLSPEILVFAFGTSYSTGGFSCGAGTVKFISVNHAVTDTKEAVVLSFEVAFNSKPCKTEGTRVAVRELHDI